MFSILNIIIINLKYKSKIKMVYMWSNLVFWLFLLNSTVITSNIIFYIIENKQSSNSNDNNYHNPPGNKDTTVKIQKKID